MIFFLAWSYVFGYGQLRHETFATPVYLLVASVWHTPIKRWPDATNAWVLGLLCGCGFLFKQQALVLVLGVILWDAAAARASSTPWRAIATRAGLAACGFALPAIVFTGIHLLGGGSLAALWYWVVGFVDTELAAMLALPPRLPYLVAVAPALLAVIGYGIAWLRARNVHLPAWWNDGKILVVLAASLVFIFPRFGAVHLQPFLALTAVVSGMVLDQLLGGRAFPFITQRRQQVLAFGLLTLWCSGAARSTLSFFSLTTPPRIYEYSHLPSLASDIRHRIGTTDCVYVLPEDEANSNLYSLLGCSPPRPWAFTAYPWYSRHGLAQRWLDAFKTLNPRYVIYYPRRWNVETHNAALVQYALDNYDLLARLSVSEGDARLLVRRQAPGSRLSPRAVQ